jgi:nucleoside triphosphate diphosphatase
LAPRRKITTTPTFSAIMELIAALRDEDGCPWDRKQTPLSMTVYMIEETFELVEAIKAGDTDGVQEELGDVLFQLLFLMHLYQQEGCFEPTDVLGRNLHKMIRRHPHVFGTDKVDDAGQVKQRWREIKQREKGTASGSLMDSVPAGLPALLRSYRISERAAGIGFDWDSLMGVIGQAESEWKEFKSELNLDAAGGIEDPVKAAEEFGDTLFTLINVGRLSGIHPETALSQATQKFIRRFKHMETMAAELGKTLNDLTRDDMEAFWRAAKATEHGQRSKEIDRLSGRVEKR